MTTHNTHDYPSHFPRRANMRVANMSYSADVNTEGRFRAELGVLPAAAAAGIISAQSIASPGLTKSSAAVIAGHRANMGKYGRNLTLVLSGAGTPAITVFGLDYLGQPMSELFAGNGTTPVVGVKIFKEVTSVTAAATAVTMNLGYGNTLGIPYAAGAILEEYVDQKVPADAGTKAVALLTAQTATSVDPRGTYIPHTNNIPNGARDITLICQAIEGDYHGLAHFTS